MKNIRVQTHFYQGYGGPDTYAVVVTCENRLLEQIECTSRVELIAEQLRLKWEKSAESDSFASDSFPLASRLCNECGGDTLDGVTMCVQKIFCNRCRDKIPQRIAEFEAETKKTQARDEEKRQADIASDIKATEAALSALFHWRDRWYFGRLPNGAARVVRVSSGGQYLEMDMEIPASEWASIMCAVSAGGETGNRYQEAMKFHAGEPA